MDVGYFRERPHRSERFGDFRWPKLEFLADDPAGILDQVRLHLIKDFDIVGYTVLGVVSDRLFNGPGSPMLPTMYELDTGRSSTTMVVRTFRDPLPWVAVVLQAVRTVDPEIPYFEITTVDRQMLEIQAPLRFEATLLTIFAVLATLLAAAGIDGLLQHAFAQSRKEIGIRLAFGGEQLRRCASCAQPCITRGGGRTVDWHDGFSRHHSGARHRLVRSYRN